MIARPLDDRAFHGLWSSQYSIMRTSNFAIRNLIEISAPKTEVIPVTDRIPAAALQVARSLHAFIEEEALPAAGIADTAGFWAGVSAIVADLTPGKANWPAQEAVQRLEDALDLVRIARAECGNS